MNTKHGQNFLDMEIDLRHHKDSYLHASMPGSVLSERSSLLPAYSDTHGFLIRV